MTSGTETMDEARQTRVFFLTILPMYVFAHAAHHFLTALPMPLLPFIRNEFGLNYTQAAYVTSAFAIAGGAAQLPAGWLADRFGRKRIVAASGVVAAVGTLITLFATNITFVFVGGCIIGVATGIFYTASWALGTSLVPKREAGRYLGISNLAGAGAGAIGAYIGGPVADFFTTAVPGAPGLGYVLIFGIYGTLFLLSVVLLAKVREPAPV